jgi:hypothetical protein
MVKKMPKEKSKRKLNCRVLIKPTADTLISIAGDKEMLYSDFLKIIWKYWKANKLFRVEKL